MGKSTETAGASDAVEAFIAYWQGQEGGQERANYQLFLIGLTEALGLARPDAAGPKSEDNHYVFERAVKFREADGATSTGRIDLYRKGAFVLEAKQSRQAGQKKAIPGQADLFVPETEPRGKQSATRAWDVLMLNARRQAEEYARALPLADGWPPFILICDVGHCIEVFADFSGQGKNYAQFPDRNSYRIYLEDLRRPEVADCLRHIWNDPHKLDPARQSAKVTREIAERLAEVSKALEARKYPAQDVAMFLMRCLFTMFAEDVELLPKDSFKDLLAKCAKDEGKFPHLVEQLWQAMDVGAFAFAIERKVLRFNGKLFKDAKALPLKREDIGELLVAAKADWRQVEPAIFGTLLEQALDIKERARLGAHYTPRAFVERLVVATVIEPLRADWMISLATAERLYSEKKTEEARKAIRDFHNKLCQTRVLDPACGTGNFLYVALELMKRLEGEVLEAVVSLGGQEGLSWLDRQTVDPHQFLGIEKNTRAAAIAELVVWLGYLQWHFRTRTGAPPEPILHDFKNIEARDAVLDWDGCPEIAVTRFDGKTVEIYQNPRRPAWPEAEFIVGNPPFVAGQNFREEFGDSYSEALWATYPYISGGADLVMFWWDRAADILKADDTVTNRFGFVTTNSITQEFNRRVVDRHVKGKVPIAILMAIPNHPWTKSTRGHAAVRIAMTVAATSKEMGLLREVTTEVGLDTDQPTIELSERRGIINPNLTVGVDVTAGKPLLANEGASSDGVKLHGKGFIIQPHQLPLLGMGRRAGLEKHLRPYRNGRDLAAQPRDVMVIDLFGLSDDVVRHDFPEVYQHVMAEVRDKINEKGKTDKERNVGRRWNRRKTYRDNWWVFGEPRSDFRPALDGLTRYVATVDTARHRVFQFLDASILCDDKVVLFASDDAFVLGVLSSRIHVAWALGQNTRLGQGDDPVYVKTRCFDPFPFPNPTPNVESEIRAIAEELDAHRKARQIEHPGLTLTDMYNVLDKLLNGIALDDDDRRIKDQGLVLMLKEYHDRLDVAVAIAYGWPLTLTDEQILEMLVALNAERAAEEKVGKVRWLRPEYQIPRFGSDEEKARLKDPNLRPTTDVGIRPAQGVLALPDDLSKMMPHVEDDAAKPKFPTNDEMAETAAVMAALLGSSKPLTPTDVARRFKGGKQNERRVKLVLDALARLGHLGSVDGGKSYVLRRESVSR
jgi:hypothetical protein